MNCTTDLGCPHTGRYHQKNPNISKYLANLNICRLRYLTFDISWWKRHTNNSSTNIPRFIMPVITTVEVYQSYKSLSKVKHKWKNDRMLYFTRNAFLEGRVSWFTVLLELTGFYERIFEISAQTFEKCVQYHRGGAVVLHNCFLVKAVEFFAIFLHQNFHSMKSCCGGQIVEFHISNSPILCIEHDKGEFHNSLQRAQQREKMFPSATVANIDPLFQSSQSPLLAEYLINLTSCQITQDFPAFAFSKGGKCVQV